VRQVLVIAAAPALFCLLAAVLSDPARAGGDADNGAKIFKLKCGMCHSTVAGQNKIGPSLAGVFGRKAATAPNYNYSEAMKNSGLTWDAATLETYLTKPKAEVSGTKMTFVGLPKDSDRADVIAYLETLK
jgi:cytochrome c